uniref:ATP-dependent RNA helicase DDX54 (Trinotate prediction) n=1 Tax=Henneguya salminicola TaxID=69463 RepID=A0A6G3MDY8_HENSL
MMIQIENAEKKIKKFVEKCSSESIKFVKSIDIMSLYPHPIFNINTKQFSTIGFVPKSKPIGNSLDNINFAKSQMNITRRKKSSLKVFDPNKIKRLNLSDFSHTSKSKKFIDSFCVSYRPIDDDSEKLYKMDEFKKNPHNLTVEFMSDELNDLKMKSKKGFKTRWDRKLKRYVNIEIQNNKKIKTESGVIIDTTYQTDHYKNWLNKTGIKSLLKSKKTDNKWSEKINKISNQLKDEKFNTVTNKNIKNVKKSSKNKFSKFTSKKRSSKN